jgi:hypothetical protein
MQTLTTGTAAALWLTFLFVVSSPSSSRADPLEGPALERAGVTITQQQISGGGVSLKEIRRQGRLVFSTPFNTADGYGDGPVAAAEDPIAPGGRPTLQNNGTFLRVNGLDGQSCLECHSIISNRSVPARFGVGGVGGSATNAIFQPTLIDVANADTVFDGRFINPPFLFGSGGIQLLAAEMTAELQALAAVAQANPGLDVPLVTKGIAFGTIRYDGGALDTSAVEGVDPDLVVRPFGRKGEFASVRDFDLGALEFHFGMQPVERVGEGVDADGDGVENEITTGEVSSTRRSSPRSRRGSRVAPGVAPSTSSRSAARSATGPSSRPRVPSSSTGCMRAPTCTTRSISRARPQSSPGPSAGASWFHCSPT